MGVIFSSWVKLTENDLMNICKQVEKHSGILFSVEEVKTLLYKNIKKGYQARINYWGANHSKNQQPLPTDRWLTRIKIEISTEEICVLKPVQRTIDHPYSDLLLGSGKITSYQIDEIIAEKLRSLKQRSYKAPRDFFDLYHLIK